MDFIIDNRNILTVLFYSERISIDVSYGKPIVAEKYKHVMNYYFTSLVFCSLIKHSILFN